MQFEQKKMEELRKNMVVICRHLYDKGLIAGADGNVSVRVEDNKIVTTPSGKHKGFLSPDQLIVTDIDGNMLQGRGKPTSELPMHIAIYTEDPDCRAIVHTHPPHTLALSLAGIRFESHRLAETELLLGEVGEVPFYPPGSRELAQAVVAHISKGPVQILQRHGAVSRGKTLMEAFQLMECLEHNAHILVMAELLKPK